MIESERVSIQRYKIVRFHIRQPHTAIPVADNANIFTINQNCYYISLAICMGLFLHRINIRILHLSWRNKLCTYWYMHVRYTQLFHLLYLNSFRKQLYRWQRTCKKMFKTRRFKGQKNKRILTSKTSSSICLAIFKTNKQV